ncbi:MAG: L,D-transpeptidase family protein [Rhizobiaceae bacterium]|nr:L,D-transpeptidase family protein [Rhizobiaceae bacterium]
MSRFARIAALSSLSMSVALVFAAPARSQTLLDLLLNKPQVQRAPVAQPGFPPPPKPKPAAKPIKKILPPSFLDYKADPLAQFSAAKVVTTTAVSVGAIGGFGLAEGVAVAGDVQIAAEKPVTDALAKLYGEAPAFLWVSGFDPKTSALAIAAHLAEAARYGLDAEDYAIALPAHRWNASDMATRMVELTRFEFQLSAAIARYVRDVEGGRINPNRISGFYDIASKVPDLASVVRGLAGEADPVAALEARHPQEPEYARLQAELAALRKSGAAAPVVIAEGTLIRPGSAHPELGKVLEAMRRSAGDALLTDHAPVLAGFDPSMPYAGPIVDFVKAWQAAKGLKPDGIIGSRSIRAAVGTSDAEKLRKVELALEKMRWFPDAYGGRYVFINQPAFTATYYNNDVAELTTRTVIGTKTNQTYLFHDMIEYVEFNPTWGVPQSIIVNEFLPKLRANPGYLDAKGYEVYNAKGQKISSRAVNWSAVGTAVPVSVIQPGGDGNALGDLKIMFPNKHSIYMHDTPARDLFARDVRAFSHGCVRLQQPHEMAAKVLGITLADVEARLAKPTNRMNVKQRLPVYVAYFTAWPNEQGGIDYFDDIYERDTHLLKAIEKTRAVRAAES